MHFRIYRDLEFGIGSERCRTDLLELKPLEKSGLSATLCEDHDSKEKSQVAPSAAAASKRIAPMARIEDPALGMPKRVSITVEDELPIRNTGITKNSPEDQSVSSTGTEERQHDEESCQEAAHLLRQMSQSSPRRPMKRNFRAGGNVQDVWTSTGSSKRVRWNPGDGDSSPSVRRQNQCYTAASTGPAQLKTVPVLKPVQGLQPYDVLFLKDFISHYNLGNRRLLVLLYRYVTNYNANLEPVRRDIVDRLYDTILNAKGRFITMRDTGFEDLPECEVKLLLGKVVARQCTFAQNGMGIIQMFQRECASIWGDASALQAQVVGRVPQGVTVIPPPVARFSSGITLPVPHHLTSRRLSPKLDTHLALGRLSFTTPRSKEMQPVASLDSSLREARSVLATRLQEKNSIKKSENPSSDEDKPESNDGGVAKEKMKKRRLSTKQREIRLSDTFQPGMYDVICTRGKMSKSHPGNKWFQNIVEDNAQRYIAATGKMERTLIVSDILELIRTKSPQGGFVKMDSDGHWCGVQNIQAREKIGQTFRDFLHDKYPSSWRAKLIRRKNRAEEAKKLQQLHTYKSDTEDSSDSDSSSKSSTS